MGTKIYNATIAKQTAQHLLEIEAIKLNVEKPFQWASGWNSPIYCDNRLSLSFPNVRKYITDALVETIRENFAGVEAIAGVATAGIPQGALIAAVLEVPFIYVRSKAKGHGMTNLIEGKVTEGQKVVVIEDLVSTGGSSLKAVNDLRDAGFEVLGMAAIFTYAFDVATQNFADANVDLVCLSDYPNLLESAVDKKYIAEDQVEELSTWRNNPSEWRK
ncbi:MAG: orotate phosphoribosyltransferase [Cytophagales bacterium]|nr:orotate phosphoribosyltransferase [Cytophagales bacterium]